MLGRENATTMVPMVCGVMCGRHGLCPGQGTQLVAKGFVRVERSGCMGVSRDGRGAPGAK